MIEFITLSPCVVAPAIPMIEDELAIIFSPGNHWSRNNGQKITLNISMGGFPPCEDFVIGSFRLTPGNDVFFNFFY